MPSPKIDARNAQIRRQAHAVLDLLLDEAIKRAARGTMIVKVDIDCGCLGKVRSAQEETYTAE